MLFLVGVGFTFILAFMYPCLLYYRCLGICSFMASALQHHCLYWHQCQHHGIIAGVRLCCQHHGAIASIGIILPLLVSQNQNHCQFCLKEKQLSLYTCLSSFEVLTMLIVSPLCQHHGIVAGGINIARITWNGKWLPFDNYLSDSDVWPM